MPCSNAVKCCCGTFDGSLQGSFDRALVCGVQWKISSSSKRLSQWRLRPTWTQRSKSIPFRGFIKITLPPPVKHKETIFNVSAGQQTRFSKNHTNSHQKHQDCIRCKVQYICLLSNQADHPASTAPVLPVVKPQYLRRYSYTLFHCRLPSASQWYQLIKEERENKAAHGATGKQQKIARSRAHFNSARHIYAGTHAPSDRCVAGGRKRLGSNV